MSLVSRKVFGPVLAAAVVTGLVAFGNPALAQPPGKGKDFGKGFVKKDFDKKGPDRGGPGADAARSLEAELARVKALEAEIEARLRQLKSPAPAPKGPKEPAPAPKGPEAARGPEGRGPGGFGPPAFGGFGPGRGHGMPGGFGPPAFGGFGPGRGHGMPGGFGPGGPPSETGRGSSRTAVEAVVQAASRLSGEQLREVIRALERLQHEKQHAAAPAPRGPQPPARPEARPEPPRPAPQAPRAEGRSAASSNAQILEKLERLSREIDEIRRSIKR
jgi:hypothetical protein